MAAVQADNCLKCLMKFYTVMCGRMDKRGPESINSIWRRLNHYFYFLQLSVLSPGRVNRSSKGLFPTFIDDGTIQSRVLATSWR